MNGPVSLDRRQVLAGGGALVVSFSLSDAFAQDHAAAAAPKPPGSLATSPYLDSWIRIDAEGITVFTGKAELGQGFKTAFQQIAEELDPTLRWDDGLFRVPLARLGEYLAFDLSDRRRALGDRAIPAPGDESARIEHGRRNRHVERAVG